MGIPAFFKKNKIILSFFFLALLLYGNTIFNGYALDDEFVTGPNSITAKGLSAIPKIFTTFHVMDEGDNNYEYRPIVKVSFALEHQIFGVNTKVSHLFNVLLYGCCLVLLYKLLLLILRNYPPFVSWASVVVFACLPIHSEVVASLKNRDVLLSFIFTISAFIFFLKYFAGRKIWNLLCAIFLLALAFLSKFDVLPYLAIIPLTVYQKDNKSLKSMIVVLAVFLCSVILYKLVKRNLLDKTNAQRIFKYFENPLYFNQEYSVRASAALNSMGFYIKMLLFPNNMACYYGYNVLPIFSFTSLYALTGLSALGISALLFFRKFRSPDLIWFGILFFTASVSMYLNFVKPAPGIVADRFLFFASIGFALILIQLLFTVKGKTIYPSSFAQLKPYQKGLSLCVLVIFSLLVLTRNKVWKDKLTLFETDSHNYPESVKLSLLVSSQTIIHLTDNSNLIKNNEKTGKIMVSEKSLMRAVEIDSSCGGCYNNLSYLLLSYENNPPLALKYLMKGYRVDSTKKELLCNIGIAYMKLNRPDSAEKYLLKAVKVDPDYEFMITFDVLQSLYSSTDPQKGIRFFEKAVTDQPSSETLNIFLAKLFFQVKDTANSLVYYRKALEINPGNSEVQRFIHRTERLFYRK